MKNFGKKHFYEKFLYTVVNPEIWNKPPPVASPSNPKRRRGRKTSLFTPVPETHDPTTSKDHEIMIFDPSVGKLVPVSSDSDDE